MSRIAIGGFLHETNSFVDPQTGFAPFEQATEKPPICRGAPILERLAGSTFGIAGFLEQMADRHQLVPLVWASATAGGTVTRDAFERVSAELVGALSQALPVDAVYLDLHGAMVSEDFDDGEGELLRRVRAAVGPEVPVVIDLDYHANVSDRMVALCDGIAAFETYPHVDRAQTGARAAALLEQVMERGRPSARAHTKAGFLIPLNGQCTLMDPSRALVEIARAKQGGDVLSAAYLAGFPPSDTRECGPSIAVHGYDRAAVDTVADAVTQRLADSEGEFLQPMLESNWGRVIFIASEQSSKPNPSMIHYAMSKTAQVSIARGLAELTRGTDVTVNSVRVAPTWTDGVQSFMGQMAAAENSSAHEMSLAYFAEGEGTSSLLQRWASPDEIANVVAFLCSPRASAINGASSRVDGGMIRSLF